MKKLLVVLALGAFAACNNGTGDSAVDSTANKIDSTANAKIDSVQTKADSISNKIDSTASAKTDSLKSKADTTKK